MNKKKRQDYVYVGLDIHKDTHTAAIVDCWGESLGTITIENRISGYTKLLNKCKKLQEDFELVFGLEDVHSYGRNLAIYLQSKGYLVKEVNSALSHMERMSYPTTKKDDDWDAKCVASVLIRKLYELPEANPQDYYWTLKMIVNRRSAMVKSLKAFTNQLHGQLVFNYPSYKKFFTDITGKTALAFYEKYPSPKYLQNIEDEEVAEFLRSHSNNYCSTKKTKTILDMIYEDGIDDREYVEYRDFLIQSLVREIRFN